MGVENNSFNDVQNEKGVDITSQVPKFLNEGTKCDNLNVKKPIETHDVENKVDHTKIEKSVPQFLRAENNCRQENIKKPINNTEVAMKEKAEAKEVPKEIVKVTIKFNCNNSLDRKEFMRQLKQQERGINKQSVAENLDNRRAYQERKVENPSGCGRALEGTYAQREARAKELQKRISENVKEGMSYHDAKEEADKWIKNQAALHNPDQIAGGNPSDIRGFGDSSVNTSIGSQWKSRVSQLEEATKEYSEQYSYEELTRIKMNVSLEVA